MDKGIYWNDELYHHGVKNQKWGVRNGPPYPLNSKGTQKKKTQNKLSNTRNKNSIEESIRSGKIIINNLPDYTVGSLTTFRNSGKEYISGLINGHDFDWQEVTNSDRYGLKTVAEIAKKK